MPTPRVARTCCASAVAADITITAISTTTSDAALAAFHAGIYRDAFPAQAEPLESWLAARRGERPYAFHVELAYDAGAIVGGIVFERYPQSGCGLVTYLTVAPGARRAGLGRSLLERACRKLRDDGAPIVFGEVDDPRQRGNWERLERFQRWGTRVCDVGYVQPSLGEGLARDRGLLLVALDAAPATELDGTLVRSFLDEFYVATEGGVDDELAAIRDAIPERVALVQLAR